MIDSKTNREPPNPKARALWKWAAVVGGVCAVLGLLFAATLQQAGVRCEACVSFEGRRACRSAAAGSPADARRAAVATACATVASGVTQTLACERAARAEVRCEGGSGPDD